jgi:predicted hotdog family 3-hydroxylacyl-ACP dehydratase
MNDEMAALIPHRPPMVMIDALVRCDAAGAVATKTFVEGSYGVDGHRVLEPALIECLAQAVAAWHRRQAQESGRPSARPRRGMLVGVSGFTFHRPAEQGRELELTVEITKELGAFCLANGRVRQGGVAVAEGALKFYIEEEGGAAA